MLIFIRTSFVRWLVIPMTFFFFILATGCDSIIQEEANNQDIGKKSTYSGEEIFQGVFFGQGEVAKLFPELWEGNYFERFASDQEKAVENSDAVRKTLQTSAYQEATETLLAWIKNKNPDFLKSFGEDLKSGNPLIVQNAIKDGASLLVKAAEAHTDREVVFSGDVEKIISKINLSNETVKKKEACLILAIALAVVTHVVNWVKYYTGTAAKSDSKLKYENTVKLITKRLSSQPVISN